MRTMWKTALNRRHTETVQRVRGHHILQQAMPGRSLAAPQVSPGSISRRSHPLTSSIFTVLQVQMYFTVGHRSPVSLQKPRPRNHGRALARGQGVGGDPPAHPPHNRDSPRRAPPRRSHRRACRPAAELSCLQPRGPKTPRPRRRRESRDRIHPYRHASADGRPSTIWRRRLGGVDWPRHIGLDSSAAVQGGARPPAHYRPAPRLVLRSRGAVRHPILLPHPTSSSSDPRGASATPR